VIPVSVITGFLGSGKTTLISRLLQSPDLADTAVIINEFGETDLDHTLIAASSENILKLMNGCICCTIREDLALELRNLFHLRAIGDLPRFNRVLIETTGLADPVPIVHTLMANTELRKVYRMQSVVTLVDALAGERTLADQAVSRRQVALADQVLITKTDLVAKEAATTVLSILSDLNPSAKLIDSHNMSVPELLPVIFSSNFYPGKGRADEIEKWLGAGHSGSVSSGHGTAIQTFTLHIERAMSLAEVILFFQELVNFRPDKLLRVKGLVSVEGKSDTPAVVHCIRDKVYPLLWLDHWPDKTTETRLVFITDGLGKPAVEKILRSVCSD
jgi:G3E family GTPase